jgi:hypothetical protein
MSLSTSDVVALIVGFAQVVATLLVGCLAIRSGTKSQEGRHNANGYRFRSRVKLWRLLPILFVAYGTYQFLTIVRLDEQFSNGQIIMIIYWSFYIAFNLISLLILWLAHSILEIISIILDTERSNISLHQGHVDTHRRVADILATIAEKSNLGQRRKREREK